MSNFIMIIPSLCLCIGFYFGYKIGKDQDIKISTPKQIVEKKKEEKKIKKEQDVLAQYIANIDDYPNNQRDIKE